MAFCPLQRRGPPTPILPLEAGQSHMNPTLSFRALGEPGTRRVPVREPCDPESMSGSAQAERWIPDSAVCRPGFLRNPGQTGFWNDNEKLRSEEHTSELQSLMRHSYAVFC